MSKTVQLVETILVGPLELGALINAWTMKSAQAEKDGHNFATGAFSETLPGLAKATAEGAGFYQALAVTSDPDRTLFARGETLIGATQTRPMVTGDTAWFSRMETLDYTVGLQVGELKAMSFSATGTSPLIRGVVLDSAAVTATGNGTGVDLGAVTTGHAAYLGLWVNALTGSPTLDVTVGSDDNSGFTTPTTRFTAAQMTGKGWQFIKLAGPVTDAWWRATRTFGGSGSITYALALGII